jgi:hypothetical protein
LASRPAARFYWKQEDREVGADGNAQPGRKFLATGATRVFSPSWLSNKMPPGVPASTAPVRKKLA